MSDVLVRSVKKALDALDYIAVSQVEGEFPGLGEIAQHLGEKQTTVRNILKTMESCGYLSREGKAYIIGAKCRDLLRSSQIQRLRQVADRYLTPAAAESNDSFVLATLIQGKRIVLARYSGGGEIVVNTRNTDSAAFYRLSSARVLLASSDATAAEQIIANYGQPDNHWPEVQKSGLDACLTQIRAQGCCITEENTINAAAVPVFDHNKILLAVIGVYTPKTIMTDAHWQQLPEIVKNLADKISHEL